MRNRLWTLNGDSRIGFRWLNAKLMVTVAVVTVVMSALVLPAGAQDSGDDLVLYLTFDDGPAAYETPQLLGLLDEYDAKATFFVTGRGANALRGVLRQIDSQGHSVQNHTMTHRSLTSLSDSEIRDELRKTSLILESVVGYEPTCARPPFGHTSNRVNLIMESQGMEQKLWDVSVHDWAQPGTNEIVRRVKAITEPGDIVLLHDGPDSTDRSQTVAAVGILLEHYSSLGYRFEIAPGCEPGGAPDNSGEGVNGGDNSGGDGNTGNSGGDTANNSGSKLVVRAVGNTGQEKIDLVIDGKTVKTFSMAGTSGFWGSSPKWEDYVYTHTGKVGPGSVRLAFKDGRTSDGGDKNVRVDYLSIDGQIYQTEDASVYSVGSWSNSARCSGGNHQLDNLACTGYFQFAKSGDETDPEPTPDPTPEPDPDPDPEPAPGPEPTPGPEPAPNPDHSKSTLVITAVGSTGEEKLGLSIGGTNVKTFTLDKSKSFWSGKVTWFTYTYVHDGKLEPSDVRLTFSNDGRARDGSNRDVRVDHIAIDGKTYQTEDVSVYSVGSWSSTARCRGGNHRLDNLACNGYFQY